MLLLAMFSLPIGYYTLLRLVVCLTAGFLVWYSYQKQRYGWVWGMGLIVLIFNPIIPLYLGRELWLVVDVAVAIVLGIYLFKFKQEK